MALHCGFCGRELNLSLAEEIQIKDIVRRETEKIQAAEPEQKFHQKIACRPCYEREIEKKLHHKAVLVKREEVTRTTFTQN